MNQPLRLWIESGGRQAGGSARLYFTAKLLYYITNDRNQTSLLWTESGATLNGGFTRLYFSAAPISHCANIEMTAGLRSARGKRGCPYSSMLHRDVVQYVDRCSKYATSR